MVDLVERLGRERRSWGKRGRGNCGLDIIYERKEKEGRGREGGKERGKKGTYLKHEHFSFFFLLFFFRFWDYKPGKRNNFFFTP